jgi:hypothetical protein
MSKRAVLRLLDELDTEGCTTTICVSPQTLDARDYDHLLPESEPDRSRATQALSDIGQSDTGIAVFVSRDRTVGGHGECAHDALGARASVGVDQLKPYPHRHRE